MPQAHINDDRLDLYAMGRLSAEALAEVEEHLLVCEACQFRLRQSDEFALLFRQAAAQPEARPKSRWAGIWRRPVGLAAAAAAMVAVLVVVTRREGSPVAPAIVSMQSLRGPEAPARVDAGRPAILVFDIETSAPGSYEARLVDRQGNEVRKARTAAQDGRLAVPLEGLPTGSYWVRVYRTGESDPIAEYGLQAGPRSSEAR
jgi:anti-sigma factor RsiW